MYRTILVPLDGSPLSERALPVATKLARMVDAKLVLVRCVWTPRLADWETVDSGYQIVNEAESYLAGIADVLTGQGLTIETAAPYSVAADGILLEVKLRQADLIVMSTHGHSGLGRWIFGSVAETVLARSPIPVMLVREWFPPVAPPEPAASDVLVPLDGSTFAEAALPYAAELAQTTGGTLVLLRVVVPSVTWYDPFVARSYSPADMIADEVTNAQAYLDGVAARFAPALPVKIEVPVGFAANIIVQRSQLPDVSQVVMATHGRTGVRRVLIGSVALEVLHHITQPLLLVRPTELVETAEEEATLAVQV